MKRKHVKTVAYWVGGFGVGTVIGQLTMATIPPHAVRFTRICSWVGAGVIAGMVDKHVHRYTNDLVDAVCDEFEILEEKHEPKYYPR